MAAQAHGHHETTYSPGRKPSCPRSSNGPSGPKNLRRLPEETMADLTDSGLFSLVSPRSDGGWGYGIVELGEVTRILAKGCASTAWVYGFYMVHHSKMVLALPSDGRRAVMGDQPYGLAASSAGFHALPFGHGGTG